MKSEEGTQKLVCKARSSQLFIPESGRCVLCKYLGLQEEAQYDAQTNSCSSWFSCLSLKPFAATMAKHTGVSPGVGEVLGNLGERWGLLISEDQGELGPTGPLNNLPNNTFKCLSATPQRRMAYFKNHWWKLPERFEASLPPCRLITYLFKVPDFAVIEFKYRHRYLTKVVRHEPMQVHVKDLLELFGAHGLGLRRIFPLGRRVKDYTSKHNRKIIPA